MRILIVATYVSCAVLGCLVGQSAAQSPGPGAVETSTESEQIEIIKAELAEQRKQIEKLKLVLEAQARIIEALQGSPNGRAGKTAPSVEAGKQPVPRDENQDDSRLAKVEEQTKRLTESASRNQIGTLSFSGDLRMQYDSLYGLLNNAVNVNNPAILGNELSARHRIRYRLRFAVRGKIGGEVVSGLLAADGERRREREFEWGIRFVAGTLANPASPNPVLTDFFSRKPFGIDQAFVAWRPRGLTGLKLVAGKQESPWSHTEMTFDNDIQVEGFSQIYSRDIKHPVLKNVTLSAWQLPMLERGRTFVRNADGTVNVSESDRAGRDLGLYGAQLQTRFALGPKTGLTVSLANLHYANTDAINAVQVFGSNLQIPVTVTIPASGSVPAQTVTTVVSIPRELLVPGNGNLGISAATSNAVNRDGRLSSGFNLIDVLTQVDFRHFKRFPITFIANYVRNTQARSVITAGPGGSNDALTNNENDGFWGEFRIQKLVAGRGADANAAVRGDLLFSYTFLRIEKDAVLTPFNWDDLIQGSDIRGHRLFFSYTADPRVTFNVTGLFNQRANGLAGPFGTNPAGSLNRFTNRIQVDTVFKF